MPKTTLLSLAALPLLACGPDALEPDRTTAETEALSPSLLLDGTVPPWPPVETIRDALPGAIDFDAGANDVLVLRNGPSRVDICNHVGCYTAITTPWMPAESATQTNASLAITSEASGELLVAQKGRGACALDCTTDIPSIPGLYGLLGQQRPPRTLPVPLVGRAAGHAGYRRVRVPELRRPDADPRAGARRGRGAAVPPCARRGPLPLRSVHRRAVRVLGESGRAAPERR